MTLRVTDTDKLMKTIDQSRGNVFFRLADGREIDLKNNEMARELLPSMIQPGKSIDLRVERQDDMTDFLSYMLYAGFDHRAA